MAEALLGIVFENLLSFVRNEFATVSGIKGKIEKLSSTLGMIKAVLEDAEEKQLTNHSIEVWLQQLKDAVYVLDDILDKGSMGSPQLGCLSSFKPKEIMFRHRIGNRLKEITRRFDQIVEDKNKFLLREGGRERSSELGEWRQTSSIIHQPQVYGRDDDKEKIVEFLLRQARSSDFLTIYPIVGLGGIGKTTLAQLVYNDERVSNHFNIKIWIYISEDFSIKRILCSVIESIKGRMPDASNLDVIERNVQKLLQNERYLLVLDDVWKTNQQMEFGLSQDKWNKLKSVLSCGSKGASILISTRDMDVAAITGTCQAHHLAGLSEDHSWLLFKQYAFVGLDKEEPAELVAIGKEIVKKCRGSPLAAQALGGLMRARSREKEWLEVKESRIWTLPDENSILPALRLSYFHLTPTLKQCFAFCAIFTKDSEIMKDDLIHLWMANGFISSRENLEIEDVGNMIWNELYQKSFFQDLKINDEGDISFKMHDLVHDLAQSVMGSESMSLENSNIADLSRSTHHVGFGYCESLKKEALEKVESLRTLYQSELVCGETIRGWFPKKCSLRVLRTSFIKLSSLGNLIHLRYLELLDSPLRTFPDSIYSLQKLEVLKLKRNYFMRCLPKHMTCLQNLRHLIVENCYSLFSMFPDIRKLSCLRTLSVYIIKLETGHSLAELRDLKLGGKLSIKGLENVGNLSEAQEANLMSKKDLQKLCLSWAHEGKIMSYATKAKQVLEALQPHSSLNTLKIDNYWGGKFPSWIGILSSLVALELLDCSNCRQLPSLGKLPSLRKLEISFMESVQYMDDDESYDGVNVKAFPSLEELSLKGLPMLERLLKVERGDMFPSLSILSIKFCPKLGLPCLPSMKSLHAYGCNSKLLRSISSFCSLTFLELSSTENLTYFPNGMMKSLTCLKTLTIFDFPKLKELPNELFNLNALEDLRINSCEELESLSEQVWEGLRSLRILKIIKCRKLRFLPEGVRHLTSVQLLEIRDCPTFQVDRDKIGHIPGVILS